MLEAVLVVLNKVSLLVPAILVVVCVRVFVFVCEPKFAYPFHLYG